MKHKNMVSHVIYKKIADLLVDIGKYVLTVILFGYFVNTGIDISITTFCIMLFVGVFSIFMGLLLTSIAEKYKYKEEGKKQQMQTEIKKAIFHVQNAEVSK